MRSLVEVQRGQYRSLTSRALGALGRAERDRGRAAAGAAEEPSRVRQRTERRFYGRKWSTIAGGPGRQGTPFSFLAFFSPSPPITRPMPGSMRLPPVSLRRTASSSCSPAVTRAARLPRSLFALSPKPNLTSLLAQRAPCIQGEARFRLCVLTEAAGCRACVCLFFPVRFAVGLAP